jgi:curli biogenesis system outer membrane secretion channel CsgG
MSLGLDSAPLRAAQAVSKAAPTKASAPAKAAAKPATPVDQVIDLVKSGLGEEMVLRAIAKENLRADLSSAEMLRLKKAGASDKVMAAMMDAAPTAPPSAASQPGVQPAVLSTPVAAAMPSPAATSGSAGSPGPAADMRRRAAIDEFDWATVRTNVAAVFGTNVDVGKGLRALLTKRVQEAGKVRVVERAKTDTIMKEQDFGASNRVKQGTNARIGQILGADVYLMGDIVAFGRDDRRKGVSLGALGFGGALGGVKIGTKEDKAVVVINYRLVDAETSEVIGSGEARGESKRKSKGLGGIFGWSGGVAGGGVDMTSSNFAETIIGEAVIDAANQIAVVLNEKAGALPARQVDIESRVAAVTGNQVTIAAGSSQGVVVGDRFDVFRIVKEIKDPVTGEVLDHEVVRLGELVIATVRERVAYGSYSGSPVSEKTSIARKVMR